MKRRRYVPPPKAPVVPAPPKRQDLVDVVAINDRMRELETKLAHAREALIVARNFVDRPWMWRAHHALAVKRKLDHAEI